MPIIQEGGGEIILEGGGNVLLEGESTFANEFTEAFAELLDVQEGVLRTRQTITIGETADIDAIIEAVARDSVFIDGGIGEKQPFRIQIPALALNRQEPAKNTAVTFTPPGSLLPVALFVLSCDTNNGIFQLLVGDPNAQA